MIDTIDHLKKNTTPQATAVFQRLLIAAAAAFLFSPTSEAYAQTVLVETNVVDFEIELNPTNNTNLEGHVQNFLEYLNAGVYEGNVINRAVDDFVLQMGNFELDPPLVSNLSSAGFDQTIAFDPVIVDADGNGVVDFDTSGLSNTRGEIALALRSGQPNSGTNSFFINLSNNSFLDQQDFIPFARIIDMTPIDEIMDLPRTNFSASLGLPGIVYSDVPVVNGDTFLVIERVSVVPEPSTSLILLVCALGVSELRGRGTVRS